MDTLSSDERSYVMSLVRAKDTKPEMVIRRLVHRLGYRYRLHVRDLPGSPDMVFPSRVSVVFVHGCFWHRHNCTNGRRLPKSRVKWWREKLEGNRRRDQAQRRKLQRLGWRVLTIWECQTLSSKQDKLADRIVRFLEEA